MNFLEVLTGESEPRIIISKGEEFLNQTWEWFLEILPHLIAAVIFFIVGLWLASLIKKIVRKAMDKAHVESSVLGFIIAFLNVGLVFLVIITTLAILGINVTSIITAFGAALVAVGLAMQNSLSNIASGILIIINKPFKAGDMLEFEEISGTVSKIELFNTHLTSLDGKEIIIPNSRLTSNNVVNCNYTDIRRLDLSYTVSYDDNISKVKSVLYGVISELDGILEEPAPVVGVGEHLDSGVELVVMLWLKNEDYYDVRFQMQERVKLAFDENQITIPYNQIVVHDAEKPSDN